MKKIFKICVIFTFSFFCGSLCAEEEVNKVKCLIQATEKQLSKQKELQKEMILFEVQKEQFILGEQTIAHTTTMIKTATHILSLIAENHLNYLFTSDYMEELALFTSIGAKKGPTRP